MARRWREVDQSFWIPMLLCCLALKLTITSLCLRHLKCSTPLLLGSSSVCFLVTLSIHLTLSFFPSLVCFLIFLSFPHSRLLGNSLCLWLLWLLWGLCSLTLALYQAAMALILVSFLSFCHFWVWWPNTQTRIISLFYWKKLALHIIYISFLKSDLFYLFF